MSDRREEIKRAERARNMVDFDGQRIKIEVDEIERPAQL